MKMEWKFKTLKELHKFVTKFYDMRDVFYREYALDCHYYKLTAEFKKKPLGRKIENESITDIEGQIGSFDATSFARMMETNQSPDHNSWMRIMKPIKEGKK